MPTGVAIRDPRGQLFDAAERVLLRDGPSGLTSRAVTTEAGVAKGVLHRHFADLEDFLTGLAMDRVARIGVKAAELRAAAGTGTVAGNLAAALPGVLSPGYLALIRLVIARDALRAWLRAATGARLPLMSESTALAAGYLEAERGTLGKDRGGCRHRHARPGPDRRRPPAVQRRRRRGTRPGGARQGNRHCPGGRHGGPVTGLGYRA